MAKPDLKLAEILYDALREPVGLLLSTSDRERARQKLYETRRLLNDPKLAAIQIRVSPFPDGDLVLCKGTIK